MSETCIDKQAPRMGRLQAGFTMPELVIVLVIGGILAAYAMPKMFAALNMRDDAWHDAVLSSLRYAQKSAVARRRLTCVEFTATTVAITTAVANPASTCTAPMAGPDGATAFATSANSSSATAVSPAGVIYFQPDGRATSDGAGTTASSRTISMSGANSISVLGETGYVQ